MKEMIYTITFNPALGFIAGFTGDEIERGVKTLGFSSDFIRIKEGMSRINVKLKSNEESKINGMGGASRIVLGMIVGAMMSIDMGGPFNKAAYVFGTAQLAEGNFEVMAAVLIGAVTGALILSLLKKNLNEEERQ